MDGEPHVPTTDRPCPLVFVVAPAFVGALVWLWSLLGRLTP
jgi:hypothetical protein